MRLNYIARYRQAQAGAASFPVARIVQTPERQERQFDFAGRNAWPVVRDGNRGAVHSVRKLNARAAAIFDRVVDKIGECPLYRYRLAQGAKVVRPGYSLLHNCGRKSCRKG